MIFWTDTETSGLDPKTDCIIETAWIATDDELNETAARSWLVYPHRDPNLWAPNVREMHQKSGLLVECMLHGEGFYKVEEQVCMFILTNLDEKYPNVKTPLAGSSLGSLDRPFIDHWWPRILKMLHYRTIDVSSIKELVNRWFPTLAYPPTDDADKPHRAMDDIRASIEELRYYRQNVFVPAVPGFNT